MLQSSKTACELAREIEVIIKAFPIMRSTTTPPQKVVYNGTVKQAPALRIDEQTDYYITQYGLAGNSGWWLFRRLRVLSSHVEVSQLGAATLENLRDAIVKMKERQDQLYARSD